MVLYIDSSSGWMVHLLYRSYKIISTLSVTFVRDFEILTCSDWLFQLIYQNCVLTFSDMDYVEACVKNVLNSLYQDSTGSLVLGSVAIPTPPANVGKL
jgi:hypothetical protein